MTKFYQVINDQYMPVRVFESLDAAVDHIRHLKLTYTDEGFYVVELAIVHSDIPAHAPS